MYVLAWYTALISFSFTFLPPLPPFFYICTSVLPLAHYMHTRLKLVGCLGGLIDEWGLGHLVIGDWWFLFFVNSILSMCFSFCLLHALPLIFAFCFLCTHHCNISPDPGLCSHLSLFLPTTLPLLYNMSLTFSPLSTTSLPIFLDSYGLLEGRIS